MNGQCPDCKQAFVLPDGSEGKRARCKACGLVFVVPEPPKPKTPGKLDALKAVAKRAGAAAVRIGKQELAALEKSRQERAQRRQAILDANAFRTKVRGVTHSNPGLFGPNRQNIIAKCQPGEAVKLVRDEDNEHDKNAVKVCRKNGQQIGFLGRDVAANIAPMMDDGAYVAAEISNITGGTDAKPILGVNLRITHM